MPDGVFFDNWPAVWRIVLVASVVYVALVLALRIAGARALAKMSAYDLMVTVALGSILATIPLDKNVTLVDGLTTIATFLVLQHVLSWVLKRSGWSRWAVKCKPVLVLYEGQMLEDRMHAVNVTDEEVRAVVRAAGKASLGECLAVVLENDGNWSVIDSGDHPDHSALDGIDVPEHATVGASDGRDERGSDGERRQGWEGGGRRNGRSSGRGGSPGTHGAARTGSGIQ